MMKNKYFLLLFATAFAFAQPANYYSSATGTGFALKTQLYNIIQNHQTISYSPGLWNLYQTTDIRPDGKVWDIYSNCNFTFGPVASGGNQDNGTGGNVECQLYNREHTFPKSWFDDAYPMYSDAFNVMPTDKKVNGLRGNLAYGVVGTATYTSTNGSKIGNNVAPGGPPLTVFEPADEFKGDIARNYFYMATCYQNLISSWENNNTNGDAFLDGSNTRVFEQWALELLYSWHIADPVSSKETNRNNAVYNVQDNRNPFIDHPEYVALIWGSELSVSQQQFFSDVVIYPNPTVNNNVNIQTDKVLDNIQLITINGQVIQKIKNPSAQNRVYTIENLPNGFYFLKISSGAESTTRKVMVN